MQLTCLGVACLGSVSIVLAGDAPPRETSGSLARALGVARGGDAVRAAVLARASLIDGANARDDDEITRKLKEALAGRAAELERALAADDASVRCSAAWALGWTRSRAAGARLADMLADPDPEVRVEAALALGRLGSRGHEAALLRFAADDDASVRAAALESLGLLGSSWSAGVRGLTDASPQVRLAAARLLARVVPDDSPPRGSEGALARALGDESAVVRACAASTLGRMGGEGAVEALRSAAMDSDEMVSGAAVEALGDIGRPAAAALVGVASAALSTGGADDAGRARAVRATRALARAGERGARIAEALGRLVREAPRDVAKTAAETLGALGGGSARRVLAGSASRREVRPEVAVAAARLGEFGPARLLLGDLTDADPWMRLAAARGLAETGNPVGFPVFIDALVSDDDAQRTYAGGCLAVYARANIDYREARPAERGELARAWRRWWLENRETFVVPGTRAEALPGLGSVGARR